MKVKDLTPEQRKDHRVLRDSDGDYLRCTEMSSYTKDAELAEAWPAFAAEHVARALHQVEGHWTVLPISEPERPKPKLSEETRHIWADNRSFKTEQFRTCDGRVFIVEVLEPQPDPLRNAAGEMLAALEGMVSYWDGRPDVAKFVAAQTAIRVAIAKAKSKK